MNYTDLSESKVRDITEKVIKDNLLNEISYRQYTNNINRISPEQKMNRSIREIAKLTKDMNKLLEYFSRTKNENQISRKDFWNNKKDQVKVLSETLMSISKKLNEICK